MTDETPVVRITMRELYDALMKIDQKVTSLAESRAHEAVAREAMNKRIDEIENTLESLRTRVMAWPSLAGAAAVVAIVVSIFPRLTS